MNVSYQFAPGAHIPLKPDLVGTTLEAMVEAHQVLTPRIVVDESEPEDAPLHPAFEWDDEVAADEFRLYQARNVIRAVRVVTEQDDGTKQSTRSFVHVIVKEVDKVDQSVYVTTQRAMSDKDLREQVLAKALGELKAFRNKYSELVELANVFAAIDATI